MVRPRTCSTPGGRSAVVSGTVTGPAEVDKLVEINGRHFDFRVEGTCTVGLGYEGPSGYAHGGISAPLHDQLMGSAHAANGRPVTVALSLRYRRPVPLCTPLRVTAWLEHTGGLPAGKARITTAEAPDTALVTAEGTFIGAKPR
jgi:acyl-coenzyme A thioesterase PaaI-like protein